MNNIAIYEKGNSLKLGSYKEPYNSMDHTDLNGTCRLHVFLRRPTCCC